MQAEHEGELHSGEAEEHVKRRRTATAAAAAAASAGSAAAAAAGGVRDDQEQAANQVYAFPPAPQPSDVPSSTGAGLVGPNAESKQPPQVHEQPLFSCRVESAANMVAVLSTLLFNKDQLVTVSALSGGLRVLAENSKVRAPRD